jgi:hypothetical protein
MGNLYNYNAILHGGILDNNTVPTITTSPIIQLKGIHKGKVSVYYDR